MQRVLLRVIVLLALASTACAIEERQPPAKEGSVDAHAQDSEPPPSVELAIAKEDNAGCESCVLDGDECLLVTSDLSDWGKGGYPSSRDRFCDAACCR